MRAVYVMNDGLFSKIGISNRPETRRNQIQTERDGKLILFKEFWIEDHSLAARVEIMSHALAGSPAMGREWFPISAEDACVIVEKAMGILSAELVENPVRPGISEAQKRALAKQRQKEFALGFKMVTVRLNKGTREAIKSRAKDAGLTIAKFVEREIDKKFEELFPHAV